MGLEERQLVPVPALEDDLVIDNMEESAAPKSQRITPLEDGPLMFSTMHTIVADANPEANIRRIASFPRTGVSATW